MFTLATPENFGGGVMAMVLPGETFQSISRTLTRVEVMPTRLRGLEETLSYPSSVFSVAGEEAPIANATSLPQVRQALHSPATLGSATGVNLGHRRVLSAWATVPSTGWKVFVEQPESAAFAPLSSKIWKTALLIAAFVAAAIALSILLARRLVRPIKRMRLAAARIGAGAYDERIELAPRRAVTLRRAPASRPD